MRGASRQFTATVRRQVRLPHLLYPPTPGGGARERFPLVLFLHGIGERGTDVSRVAVYGPPLLAESGRDFPFYLAAPQCPAESSWILELDTLRLLIKDLVRNLPVDTSRVYLTGLSMGGFGTWHLAVENPHAFAAIAPICGAAASVTGLAERLGAIKHLPVWAFHGARDDTIPLGEQQGLVEALRAAGGNVQFTVYPEAGHDSWTEAYGNPKLYEWMLAQSNPAFRI